LILAATGLSGLAGAQDVTRAAAQTAQQPDEAALDRAIDALLAAEPAMKPAPESAPDMFGLTTIRLGATLYDSIWREASSSALPAGNAELNACIARLGVLPIRERAAAANAWVNARITYAPDRVLTNHHWGTLATGLAQGRGEREDIALAKLQLLVAAGVPRRDVFLVLVRDWSRVADDALLAVRDGGKVYVLDSKADALLDAAHTDRYFPVLAFSADGAWIFGRRTTSAGGTLPD
jgi:predicted transglutaminase-like cysteine proteinase